MTSEKVEGSQKDWLVIDQGTETPGRTIVLLSLTEEEVRARLADLIRRTGQKFEYRPLGAPQVVSDSTSFIDRMISLIEKRIALLTGMVGNSALPKLLGQTIASIAAAELSMKEWSPDPLTEKQLRRLKHCKQQASALLFSIES